MALIFKKKSQQFQKNLSILEEYFNKQNNFIQDAIIFRFKIAVELFQKTLKIFLIEQEKIEVYSPKNIMRECRNIDILTENETSFAIDMIIDRNNLIHNIDQNNQKKIYAKIPKYVKFMQKTLKKLSNE